MESMATGRQPSGLCPRFVPCDPETGRWEPLLREGPPGGGRRSRNSSARGLKASLTLRELLSPRFPRPGRAPGFL